VIGGSAGRWGRGLAHGRLPELPEWPGFLGDGAGESGDGWELWAWLFLGICGP